MDPADSVVLQTLGSPGSARRPSQGQGQSQARGSTSYQGDGRATDRRASDRDEQASDRGGLTSTGPFRTDTTRSTDTVTRVQTRQHHRPIGEIALPHGVQDYDTIDGRLVDNLDYSPPSDKDERTIFQYLLRPSDSYNAKGVYWADMGLVDRFKFVSRVNNLETRAELRSLWIMFKEDPLSPMSWLINNTVLPGAGLGLEGYVLFSIGNIEPLFQAVWPECWAGAADGVCNPTWLSAVKYLEICGIIMGQIVVGLIGDGVGRRFGLIQDVAVMFLGLLMLISSWGTTLNGWVICYAWASFVYGFGVGGEYPMTATSGMEHGTSSVRASSRQDRLHRGRKVTQAFLMQGWGQLLNQAVLIVLLLIMHHGSGNPPYSKVATQWTFRIAFAFPLAGTLWLLYYRIYKMPRFERLAESKTRHQVTGYDLESLRLVFKHFGGRLVATTVAWFANDVFFYGNKLFQNQFIRVISPQSANSVMTGWLYNMINLGVSLAGYYLASFLIDHKLYGRCNMQAAGFLMCFLMFVIPSFHYDYYTSPQHVHEFQAMYYLSSFFNQFGPNSVTFLVAAEVFPTPVRATAHGFSAACGKLGSLLASVLYNYIDDQTKFYVVPWFGLAGLAVTIFFLPDTTGLDLQEQDRRWHFLREGKLRDYHGPAIHPQHLSLWERFNNVQKYYDPDTDHRQKVKEMRKDWMQRQREKFAARQAEASPQPIRDPAVAIDEPVDDENDLYTPEAHHYFYRTSPMILPQHRSIRDPGPRDLGKFKLPEPLRRE